MTQQEMMMQQVISLIAQGVVGVIKRDFPNLIDPVAPVPVKRVRVDASGNEQEVTEVANLAQLLAELNDNVIDAGSKREIRRIS
jgi:hypothetical protein